MASFIGILGTAFGNLDKVATMERMLWNLRQANQDFSTYYTEFVRYATNTTWNKVANQSHLEEGLCHELKNDLIGMDEPELFADVVTLLQKLDQKRHCLTMSVIGCKIVPPAQVSVNSHIHTHIHIHTLLRQPRPPGGRRQHWAPMQGQWTCPREERSWH